MTKADDETAKTAQQAADRQAAHDAHRAKVLERARRTGRKTVLSRLSTKAAAEKPFLGAS